MPNYNIATAAFAIGTSKKWVDNLTSHFRLPGVLSRKRGMSREFSFEGVVLVSLIRVLCEDLNVPTWRAAEIASSVAGSKGTISLTLKGGLVLDIHTETFAHQVRQRLLEAAESVPRTRRGRPPRTRPTDQPTF
ncbi:MAG: hypothetical protein WBQ26_06295 [Gemmatimonadaceae bacterium]